MIRRMGSALGADWGVKGQADSHPADVAVKQSAFQLVHAERDFHEVGQLVLVPGMGNVISVPTQFIKRQKNIRMGHVEREGELYPSEETGNRPKPPEHALLASRDVVRKELCKHRFQLFICKRAGDHRNKANMVTGIATRSAAV